MYFFLSCRSWLVVPVPPGTGVSDLLKIFPKQYGPWKNMWFKTTEDLKLSSLWLRLYHHEAHSEEGMLIDDVVVSSVPVGATMPCE